MITCRFLETKIQETVEKLLPGKVSTLKSLGFLGDIHLGLVWGTGTVKCGVRDFESWVFKKIFSIICINILLI